VARALRAQRVLLCAQVDFIEQFNEKLLVKQEGENLQIVDVHTAEVLSVSKTKFVTPSAFIFLFEKNLFLTFRQREVVACVGGHLCSRRGCGAIRHMTAGAFRTGGTSAARR